MQGIQNSNIYILIYICKYVVYMNILNVYKYIYEKNNFGDLHFTLWKTYIFASQPES